MIAICKHEDCDRDSHARGLCRTHYTQSRRAEADLAVVPAPAVDAFGPWREQAACSDSPIDLFFDAAYTTRGLAVCATCDVRDTCLEWAMENVESEGILGGTTERQRAHLAKERGLEWPMIPHDSRRVCNRAHCHETQAGEGLCREHLRQRQAHREREQRKGEVLTQAERIIADVAEAHGMDRYELTGRSRAGDVVVARNLAMAEVRDRLGLSFQAIGKLFDGRDHTSVMHGVRNAVRGVAA